SGYRTYVDDLMQPEVLAVPERRRIRDELRDASRELDEIIDNATRVLGRLSNSLAFVTRPETESHVFKHVQMISLGARTGVAVVVTSLGVAAQSMFELGVDTTPDELTRLSNALNARFANRPLRDISDADVGAVVRDARMPDDLRNVVSTALRSARSNDEPGITAAGAQNLLDQPEFQDVSKL